MYSLKGIIWDITSSATILEITVQDTAGVGFCIKPIWQMCGK